MASQYSSSDDESVIPSPTPTPPRKENNQSSRVRKVKTIAVEGNIGCGKTTFLGSFASYNNVEILPEPVDKWKNVMGTNALDLMYKDAERWGGAFQSLATLCMLDHHAESKKSVGIKLIERSIYSTRYCFMQNLFDSGLMPPIEFAMLNEVHDWVKENENIHLDLIVYLRANPDVCAERIKMRNRAEECGVPMDYLESLHRLHDDWLLLGKKGPLPCPVLVIDANKSQTELQQEIDSLRQDILAGVSNMPSEDSGDDSGPKQSHPASAPHKLFSQLEISASHQDPESEENPVSNKLCSDVKSSAPKFPVSQSENAPHKKICGKPSENMQSSKKAKSQCGPLSPNRGVLRERNSNY